MPRRIRRQSMRMESLFLTDKVTPDEARKVLEAEQRERLEACHAEIQAVCKKRGCALAAQIGVTQDGRIVANVVLTNAA